MRLVENRQKELKDVREAYLIDEAIEESSRYHKKLLQLKKDMAQLTAKSKDLEKRALYVKSVKVKEERKMELERERQSQIERDLAPRYAI